MQRAHKEDRSCLNRHRQVHPPVYICFNDLSISRSIIRPSGRCLHEPLTCIHVSQSGVIQGPCCQRTALSRNPLETRHVRLMRQCQQCCDFFNNLISSLASGHKYPVSWSTIPSNIYLALNLVFHGLLSSRVTSLEKWRSRNALPGGLSTIFSNFRPATLYLVPSTPSTDFPLIIPHNVHGCGPILPPLPRVCSSHTLNLPPTILFNLGSHTKYTSSDTTTILSALRILLSNRPTLCVTWKYQPADRHAEKHNMHIIAVLPPQISLRITQISWLPDTPLSLLSRPSTVLSVHHGGANSFHEALAAGVPQSYARGGLIHTSLLGGLSGLVLG